MHPLSKADADPDTVATRAHASRSIGEWRRTIEYKCKQKAKENIKYQSKKVEKEYIVSIQANREYNIGDITKRSINQYVAKK